MQFGSLLVSTTEVCTIGCRHCGFTGSTREREPTEAELADWVRQACDAGIPKIILTGGEPFQRFPRLRAAVRAAADHPAVPQIGVFTSSFWGRNPATVATRLGELRGLTHLYLSTDPYHQERVPAGYVRNVIDGALAAGIPDISLCITVENDEQAGAVLADYGAYRDRVMVHVDKVIPTPFIAVGHAPALSAATENYDPFCYLDTPLINPNGDVSACHIGKSGAYVNLSEQVYFLGNLHERRLEEIFAAAEGNYEYQFLRVYGPQGVARMIAADPGLSALLRDSRFANGCDLCYKVLRSAEGRAALRELVADPFQRQLVDAARLVRFGEDVDAPAAVPR
ncbi:MAG TPA: radical SAM/SPASM domain-containing protein [Streptosporangiaceae bacterium]|jgi:Radical SAM superfamily/Iron-sulfur cluster-binding domain|nr:radical SAM/SPASM domain-containing protein [Streptosporangiaceae bacterium]